MNDLTPPPSFRLKLLLACLCLIGCAGGCRICADCEREAYSAYGGKWQRTDRHSGRVGSLFDPAGNLRSDLVAKTDPRTPEEMERALQNEQESDTDQDDAADDGERDIDGPPDAGTDDDRADEDRDADDEMRRRQRELEDELDRLEAEDLDVST